MSDLVYQLYRHNLWWSSFIKAKCWAKNWGAPVHISWQLSSWIKTISSISFCGSGEKDIWTPQTSPFSHATSQHLMSLMVWYQLSTTQAERVYLLPPPDWSTIMLVFFLLQLELSPGTFGDILVLFIFSQAGVHCILREGVGSFQGYDRYVSHGGG